MFSTNKLGPMRKKNINLNKHTRIFWKAFDNVHKMSSISLPWQWRHNKHGGVSNHRRFDCLLNRLVRRRSKKTSKLCVTGLYEGNPPVTPPWIPLTNDPISERGKCFHLMTSSCITFLAAWVKGGWIPCCWVLQWICPGWNVRHFLIF